MKKKAEEKKDPVAEAMISFYNEIVACGAENYSITATRAARIYNYRRNQSEQVSGLERLYDKKGRPVPVYYSRQDDIYVSMSEIRAKFDRIVSEIILADGKYVRSSLMGGNANTPATVVKYMLSTTGKRMQYTYGLKYRRPTTYEVPCTREQALSAFGKGMCDVKEYQDYIDIQEFSGNDMW